MYDLLLFKKLFTTNQLALTTKMDIKKKSKMKKNIILLTYLFSGQRGSLSLFTSLFYYNELCVLASN